MKETTLMLEQIETIITGYPDAPYFIRQNIVVPNCDWGFLNHEADLLVLNKTKRLVEIEIKLLRLLGLRIWNMKKKLAEHQIEPQLF